MANARRITPAPVPPAAPAIRATSFVDEPEPLELDDVGVVMDVAVGMTVVDDGELALMHEKLPDPKTWRNPEIPPGLPVESVTKYMRFVPEVTSTTEVKVALSE
jgi:hypothetical protein